MDGECSTAAPIIPKHSTFDDPEMASMMARTEGCAPQTFYRWVPVSTSELNWFKSVTSRVRFAEYDHAKKEMSSCASVAHAHSEDHGPRWNTRTACRG